MSTPLYILSFRQRDELAAIAAAAGWHVVSSRRAGDAARRFGASRARVAVLDARGAFDEGVAAAAMLGPVVDGAGAALVALVSRDDAPRVALLRDAGATHFLASRFGDDELVETLRFAELHAVRVAARRGRGERDGALGWRYVDGQVTMTVALAALLDLPERVSPVALLRRLERVDRATARLAFARLAAGAATTGFAHELATVGRVVEHIQRDADGNLQALVEPLAVPDTDALLTVAFELRRAFDAGEIEMLFQPQVEMAGGRVVGVEALMRWRHPRLGELGAEALLDAAERAGLAGALSAHVQSLALAAASAWPDALRKLRLSVNVTAADIAEAGFVERLLERVDASGFPRGRLTVEITESELIDDLDRAAFCLAALRAAGLRVAIDDFGTGYSSLAYLKALPLDYLKIDRAIGQDITGSPRDRVVVHGVIDMARSLGLAVIAEGVETEEQRALLARAGCDLYQGFLCAEPIDATALAALVEDAHG